MLDHESTQEAPVQWRDARQVAKFLGISVQHVYYLTDIGELVGVTMGRRRLWLQEDLDAYIVTIKHRAQQEAEAKRARFLEEQERKRMAKPAV